MELFIQLLRGFFGTAFLLGACWLISFNRKAFPWRIVIVGILMQWTVAVLILHVPYADRPIEWISSFFVALLGFTDVGTRFVFGWLGAGPDFWGAMNEQIEAEGMIRFGLIFGFKILPTVIFFSALTSVLYFLGILQFVVKGFAWMLQKSMGLSGVESLAAAANVFIGQTEAPLMVKPYIEGMSKSEILCLMTGGMATIAGGVFGAYVWILGGADPVQQQTVAKHLLTASIISAPAAIVAAKILLPETEAVDQSLRVSKEKIGANVIDAACQGTSQGLMLALNIAAMLIAFLAFIAMFNAGFGLIGDWTGLNGWIASQELGSYDSLSLELIFGLFFAPIAWIIGIDPGSLLQVGHLMGLKLVANEFVAYEQMGSYIQSGALTDPRAILISTYALCGFSSFGSIGIQIGGIAVLAPSQRENLSRLGLASVFGGTVACLLTGVTASMFS